MNSAFQCAFCFRPGLLLSQPRARPHLSRSPGSWALRPLPLSLDFSALLSPHWGTSAASPASHQLCIADRVVTLGVLGPVVSGDGRTRGTCRNVRVHGQHYPPPLAPACENPVTHFLTVAPCLPFSSCPRVSSFSIHLHLPAGGGQSRESLRSTSPVVPALPGAVPLLTTQLKHLYYLLQLHFLLLKDKAN